MSPTVNGERKTAPPIRLWPGAAAVALQWLLRFVIPTFIAGAIGIGYIGAALCTVLILIWWLFFSRVPLPERFGGLALIAAAAAVTPGILDKSIAGGMQGMMFFIYAVPGLCLALVAWAALAAKLSTGPRRVALALAILAACGFWALFRTKGIWGEGGAQLAWRWSETDEQKLLTKVANEPLAPPGPPAGARAPERPAATSAVPKTRPAAPETAAAWPGFRGARRDGTVSGVRIKTGWDTSPPVELWRRPVGAAWSSFAVQGSRVYTQEQRGEFEVVSCYDAATGKPLWLHQDAARFWESNGGAGPRGTPTLYQGRVYTMGATGILNALDAASGALAWTRNAVTDTGVKIPGWGISSSPLAGGDKVIVAASGRLAAYNLNSGDLIWKGPPAGVSYSSPHWTVMDGIPQVLILDDAGITSVAPATGQVLWKHAWPGFTSLQPALTTDGELLITTGNEMGGLGTRCLAVSPGADHWNVTERWTSNGLKPYFNDLVVHKGHAYGFDGAILSAIDLQDGKRKWKGGRYGHGQLILLSDQDLLLVLSEEGELALVRATPEQFSETARVRVLDDKTWNHPVLAGGTLLVRNSKEMAAFRLALQDR